MVNAVRTIESTTDQAFSVRAMEPVHAFSIVQFLRTKRAGYRTELPTMGQHESAQAKESSTP